MQVSFLVATEKLPYQADCISTTSLLVFGGHFPVATKLGELAGPKIITKTQTLAILIGSALRRPCAEGVRGRTTDSHKANAVKLENTSIFGEFPVHMRKTHLRDQMADVSNASRNASLVLLRCAPVSPGQESRIGERRKYYYESAVIIRHNTFDCSQIGFH